jgi:hydroxyacylglutathione hydrolase
VQSPETFQRKELFQNSNTHKMRTWKTKSGYSIIKILSGRSNVFLLTNGQTNILIDTSYSRLWNKLQRQLNKLQIKHIDYLILTHAHFDHAANASKIKEKYRPGVIVQKNEAACLAAGDNILPKGTTLITRPLVSMFGKQIFNLLRYKPCKYDLTVDSLFGLAEFGFNGYLMSTPGHSAGSMSLIIDDEIAIVGDTMFGLLWWSVFPPYAEDVNQMIHSWGKLLETNCSIFLPSHGTANKRSIVQKDYNRRIKQITRNN